MMCKQCKNGQFCICQAESAFTRRDAAVSVVLVLVLLMALIVWRFL